MAAIAAGSFQRRCRQRFKSTRRTHPASRHPPWCSAYSRAATRSTQAFEQFGSAATSGAANDMKAAASTAASRYGRISPSPVLRFAARTARGQDQPRGVASAAWRARSDAGCRATISARSATSGGQPAPALSLAASMRPSMTARRNAQVVVALDREPSRARQILAERRLVARHDRRVERSVAVLSAACSPSAAGITGNAPLATSRRHGHSSQGARRVLTIRSPWRPARRRSRMPRRRGPDASRAAPPSPTRARGSARGHAPAMDRPHPSAALATRRTARRAS